ncbi:CDP-alcohol phosphatidyltransferase family protein [Jeongeupia naejangsanensis]|uniref:CDP-alcohol phosphatidyltransferase family protein n=1 Tax=Jeongeupia naejangsanensis TaxID=613195 RepID=A0ABS2BG29_9NEIS|nr:CDP-alcohol phosphatidyltransferase family protein [Jeongeupia naejangsanensis]MBM3114415.1 CDP-alcohol phosphatidyltransferase family protein [Jeongeupia naejangsanensis]
MTLYDLKPAFQSLLRPVLRTLHRAGITANQITLLALLASVALGLLLALNPVPPLFLMLPAFLLVRMALNAIDGMLAREFKQQSRLGALLNEAGDILSDSALYLPFALLPGADPVAVVVMALLANLTEFLGVAAQTVGASRRYDGPLGKSDRAFVLGAYALLVGLYTPALAWSPWLFWTLALLCAFTCLNRARRALREAA